MKKFIAWIALFWFLIFGVIGADLLVWHLVGVSGVIRTLTFVMLLLYATLDFVEDYFE